MGTPIEPDWLRRTRATLEEGGVNVSGVASAEAFPGWLPGARSIVVFGSGGPAFWEGFVRSLRERPARLRWRLHPLDAYARELRMRADPEVTGDRRWVLCGALEARQPDFRALALAAGLGHRSRLDLLLHPVYGPWMGLRMACFTREEIPPGNGPLPPSPCEHCPAPCEQACPAAAISERGWDVDRCAAFHVESERCRGVCHARDACPEGAGHRYPELERLYHDDRRRGRRELARSLGICDVLPGAGPFRRPSGLSRWISHRLRSR